MTLKAIVETTDGIPEALREFYQPTEDGKGFKLSVEPVGGFALEDVSRLKRSLEAERGSADRAAKELARYGAEFDPDAKEWRHKVNPGRLAADLKRLDELSQIDPAKEADRLAHEKVEAHKRQLVEKHSADMDEVKQAADRYRQMLENVMVTQQATRSIAEAKGSVDLLLPHVERHCRTREVDGKMVVDVVDASGNPRVADSSGRNMTIDDLVAEMKGSDVFGRAFEASGKSGAGMAQMNGTGGGAATRKAGDWAGGREGRLSAIATRFPDLPVR